MLQHLSLGPNTQDAARIDTAFDQPVLPPLNGEEPGVRTDEIERLRFMDVALMLVDRFEACEFRVIDGLEAIVPHQAVR